MMRNLIKKMIKESDFEWIEKAQQPNYGGHPQGVVHLRSHGEISEFIKILNDYNNGWGGPYDGYNSFHIAFDYTLDQYEAGEFYDGWVPTLSASFFIYKKYPNKLISGYWDVDVDKSSVQEWLDTDSEPVDKENWELYYSIDDVKRIFGLLN